MELVIPTERAMTDKERFALYKKRKRLSAPTEINTPVIETVQPIDRLAAPVPKAKEFEDFITGLRIPDGRLQGDFFTLQDFQREFLEKALDDDTLESWLITPRKNGKTATGALLIAAHLFGPWNRPRQRLGYVSLNGDLAGDVMDYLMSIVEENSIDGVIAKRSPQPGHVIGHNGARCDFLAASKFKGQGKNYVLAVADEIGLWDENARPLLASMKSSVSASDGKFIALSIRGHSDFVADAEARADLDGVHYVRYAGDPTKPLDDEENWYKANPGLPGIKSIKYMRQAVASALASPNDQAHFAAYDLGLEQAPTQLMVLSLADWQKHVVTKDLPPREGKCFLGFDAGESASMTCAVAIFENGRMEVRGAFPSIPDLKKRGEGDGVGGQYERMVERGELVTYPGHVTDIAAFMDKLIQDYADYQVIMAADTYRQKVVSDAMWKAGCHWKVDWRRQGRGADGHYDVDAFQKLAMTGNLACEDSLMMAQAIRASTLHRDNNGNLSLDKSKQKGRIDAMQAGCLAAGMLQRHLATPSRKAYHGMV